MRTFLQADLASGGASPALPSGLALREERPGSLSASKAPFRQLPQPIPEGFRPSAGLAPNCSEIEVILLSPGPVSKYAFPG